MNMIKKVAAVINAASYDQLAPIMVEHMARAAIEAMREPTEAMLKAGKIEYAGEQDGEDCNLELQEFIAEKCYRAMMAAAK